MEQRNFYSQTRALAGRAFAALLLALALLVLPKPDVKAATFSAEDKAVLAEIEEYLNALGSLVADFTQIGPQGGLSRGRFYLQRPGKLRFEYDPPVPLLLISNGLWLTLYDRELEEASRWPISQTPLGILVRDKISFTDGVRVTGLERHPGFLRLRLVNPEYEDEGAITLTFQTPALTLRHWRVEDAQGQETNVSLTGLESDVAIDPQLFIFDEPVAGDGLSKNR